MKVKKKGERKFPIYRAYKALNYTKNKIKYKVIIYRTLHTWWSKGTIYEPLRRGSNFDKYNCTRKKHNLVSQSCSYPNYIFILNNYLIS